MKDNNIRAEWYKDKRSKIEKTFQSGKILHDKRKTYQSESNKYKISITPVVFKKLDRFWAYTLGKIYKGNDPKPCHTIRRNSDKFPHVFIEDHNGHDYLLCGEDIQGQMIVELDTGKVTNYIGEKALRDMEFCWQKFHVSPSKNLIAIEGYSKSNHKELAEYRGVRFFNFEQPMILPYYEIGDRIAFHYDEAIGRRQFPNFCKRRTKKI